MATPKKRYNNNRNHRQKKKEIVDYQQLFAKLSKNGVIVNVLFFESLNFFGEELTKEIIRLLDDSIEYIHFSGTDLVVFKRFNNGEFGATTFD